MKLRQFGFFREQTTSRDDPEIAAFLNESAQPDEEKIVEYLRGGIYYIVSPGPATDVVSNGFVPFTLSILTDGVWEWPEVLAYYVERYHLSPPNEFVQHLRSRRFQPPKEGDVDLTALELENIVKAPKAE